MCCSPAFIADIVLADGDDEEEENNAVRSGCTEMCGPLSLLHTEAQNNFMFHKHIHPRVHAHLILSLHVHECKSQKLDGVGVGAWHMKGKAVETSSPPSFTQIIQRFDRNEVCHH